MSSRTLNELLQRMALKKVFPNIPMDCNVARYALPFLQKNIETDIVVVGGGIAVISTAILLKQKALKAALIESDNIINSMGGVMRSHRKTLAVLLFGLCTILGGGDTFAASANINNIDAAIFKSVDLNNNGNISREEILHYTDLVFLSMDSNSNDTLTVEEFLEWDPGYLHLAEQLGKTAQFTAIKKEIYRSRDLNGDGTLDHDEFSTSALYDFYKADKDKDRALNQREFLEEYQILKAVRSICSASSCK